MHVSQRHSTSTSLQVQWPDCSASSRRELPSFSHTLPPPALTNASALGRPSSTSLAPPCFHLPRTMSHAALGVHGQSARLSEPRPRVLQSPVPSLAPNQTLVSITRCHTELDYQFAIYPKSTTTEEEDCPKSLAGSSRARTKGGVSWPSPSLA
ncbi:hypothetical protein EV421DRAFT_1823676 [Armillaria borealis]|uniref:Uncharacterized protein n=1 Tax=Armillaria borealis TaxID=47425 RepID=A0AA39JB63_9AGAR|nr:hypothetical protein EV421DRAFT_1823676 [Armillaria borealis]